MQLVYLSPRLAKMSEFPLSAVVSSSRWRPYIFADFHTYHIIVGSSWLSTGHLSEILIRNVNRIPVSLLSARFFFKFIYVSSIQFTKQQWCFPSYLFKFVCLGKGNWVANKLTSSSCLATDVCELRMRWIMDKMLWHTSETLLPHLQVKYNTIPEGPATSCPHTTGESSN